MESTNAHSEGLHELKLWGTSAARPKALGLKTTETDYRVVSHRGSNLASSSYAYRDYRGGELCQLNASLSALFRVSPNRDTP